MAVLLFFLLVSSLVETEAYLRPAMARRPLSTTALGLTPPQRRMLSTTTDGNKRTLDVLFTAPLVTSDDGSPIHFFSRVRKLCLKALMRVNPELAFKIISHRVVASFKQLFGGPTSRAMEEDKEVVSAIKDQHVRGYVKLVRRAKESAKNVLRDYISFQKRGERTFHLTHDEAVTRDMGLIGLALRSYMVRAAKRGDQAVQRSVVSAAMRALNL